MSTLTTTRLDVPVRVNLLPPEIGSARRLRRLKVGLGAGLGVVALVVAALYWQATGQVSTANEALVAAQAENTALQHQVAQYADVPAVYAQVAGAQAQLAAVQANEVHWSTYLADLSLKMPPRVWLTSMSVTENFPVTGAGQKSSGDPLAPPGTIGTVSFSGYAMTHQDVAVWLDALKTVSDGAYPYFTNSTESKIGTTDVVQVSSSLLIKQSAIIGTTPKAGN